MDPIQPISRYLIAPLLRWKNHSTDLKYLEETERAQYLPPADLAAWQRDRLRELLRHAAAHCPFYAERFAKAGFDPASVTSPADLEKVPLLTKADIQQHRDTLMATNFGQEDRIPNQTGGSTGSPLRFVLNRESVYRRVANTIRHDRWAGLEPYHKGAAIWGHQRDLNAPRTVMDKLREMFFSRRVVFDTSSMSDETVAGFVERLNREKPSTYVAYANAMYLIARYVRQRNLAGYHRPKSIITSAEMLTDHQRRLIEEVFGCPVYNRYGSREFSVIASECSAHDGMHIAADTVLVEVVRGTRTCGTNEEGQLVITDLHNYAMPFIRYLIGDVGVLLDSHCPCGRTLPLMDIVGGRVTDFVVTPEGTVVSGAAMTIYFIARVPGVTQAQLVQKRQDFILLRLATDQSYGDVSKRMIAESVERFFGPRMRYDIEPVESIPLESSGKYRFSISEIDPLPYLT